MELQTQIINKNWEIGTTPMTLDKINKKEVNIAIYDRDISSLTKEVKKLLCMNIELRFNGSIETILNSISTTIDHEIFGSIIKDIHQLLKLFGETSDSNSFRLLLASVNSNMCQKFHTDINDLRMLCTYYGPGTLWLTDDNINRQALNSFGDEECIALDESKIQQAGTGSAIILKGAIYLSEGTKAVVHRSPTIEESVETRLLLRIDTNEFLNFE
jgi:hypothetical protein